MTVGSLVYEPGDVRYAENLWKNDAIKWVIIVAAIAAAVILSVLATVFISCSVTQLMKVQYNERNSSDDDILALKESQTEQPNQAQDDNQDAAPKTGSDAGSIYIGQNMAQRSHAGSAASRARSGTSSVTNFRGARAYVGTQRSQAQSYENPTSLNENHINLEF